MGGASDGLGDPAADVAAPPPPPVTRGCGDILLIDVRNKQKAPCPGQLVWEAHLGICPHSDREEEGPSLCLAEWPVFSVGTQCCRWQSPDASPRRACREVSCKAGVSRVVQTPSCSGPRRPGQSARWLTGGLFTRLSTWPLGRGQTDRLGLQPRGPQPFRGDTFPGTQRVRFIGSIPLK